MSPADQEAWDEYYKEHDLPMSAAVKQMVKVAGTNLDLSGLTPLEPFDFNIGQKVVCSNPANNQALMLGHTYKVDGVSMTGLPIIKGAIRKKAKFVTLDQVKSLAIITANGTPLVKEADPELEKLLQEEEEIEAALACPLYNPNGIKLFEVVQYTGHGTDSLMFVGVVKDWETHDADQLKIWRTAESLEENTNVGAWFFAPASSLAPYSATGYSPIKAKAKKAVAKAKKAHKETGGEHFKAGDHVECTYASPFSDLVIGDVYKVEGVKGGHPIIDGTTRDLSKFKVVPGPTDDEDNAMALLDEIVMKAGQETGAMPDPTSVGYIQIGFTAAGYLRLFCKNIPQGNFVQLVLKDGTVYEKIWVVGATIGGLVGNLNGPTENIHHPKNTYILYQKIAGLYLP